MSTKKDILAEINKKAQKIREKRVDAANNKSIEAAVFDFFCNIEQSWGITHEGYDPYLSNKAKEFLKQRLRAFDSKVRVSIEYFVHPDPANTDKQTVRGVTIWWSQTYISHNNVDPSLYIDVTEMMLS